MNVNAPLPTYDMMTGQLVTSRCHISTKAAAMMANHADVVHVQLLDRMIVVPREIVNVSLQSICTASCTVQQTCTRTVVICVFFCRVRYCEIRSHLPTVRVP